MKHYLAVAALAGALTSPLAEAQDTAKGDPAKAQQTATTVCAACHGADGNSPIPANPNLAGQHAQYIFKQLQDFKPQGGKEAARKNPIMSGMAAPLSEDDMRNLAAYFDTQKPNPGTAKSAELAERGERIYRGGIADKGVPACAGCHSPNGAGIPAQFPRLAGQHAQYVEAQLKAFRSGTRANDPNGMMRDVTARLEDEDIRALAQYISGLR